MSFLNRLADRIDIPGSTAARRARAVTLRPKGLVGAVALAPEDEEEAMALRSADAPGRLDPVSPPVSPPAHRMEAVDEEQTEAQPLRRSDSEQDEASPLRRREQTEDESLSMARIDGPRDDSEGQARPRRRQGQEREPAEIAELTRSTTRRAEAVDDEAHALRRSDDEQEAAAQALHRQQQEDAETAQSARALRRADTEPGEDEPARSLRRSEVREEESSIPKTSRMPQGQAEMAEEQSETPQPETPLGALRRAPDADEGLDPESASPLDDLAAEPEPPTAMAIRRDLPGSASATVEAPAAAATGGMPLADSGEPGLDLGYGLEPTPPAAALDMASADLGRPSVLIDQLDVLIHEPAHPGSALPRQQQRSRGVRARLLRRL